MRVIASRSDDAAAAAERARRADASRVRAALPSTTKPSPHPHPNPSSSPHLRRYASRYHAEKGSVLALGDLTSYLGQKDGEAGGVCVLEEPEHLNWFHHGRLPPLFKCPALPCTPEHLNWCHHGAF